ncbi:endonuclease III [Castellaniella sp.]|uniref:endonuclease III n=1 Tax=Castellaniella sp. TaxID=1955812 RepID=UPI003569B7A4
MTPAAVAECFRRLRAANPTPVTELEYKTNFQLLIAVILSAQSTDRAVNLATRQFFPAHGTPEGLLALGEEGLSQAIRTIGLYRTKTRNILQTCALILERHGGAVPNDRAALEALPGVGRKTANVVLNTAFGQAVMAVDTHVFRVANRTGIAPGKTVREVEQRLMERVPEEYLLNAHHWLILHGRHICLARKPKCPECLLRDLCEYPNKTIKLSGGNSQPAAPAATQQS